MIKTIFVKGMMVALSATFLWSCSDDNDSKVKTRFEPIPFTTEEKAALIATEPFSLDLFKKYTEVSGEPNVAISPLSATFAMAMVANGATGETQAEILTALGFNSETGLGDMNAYAQRLMQNLRKVDKSTEAIMANAMFYKNGWNIEKSYTSLLKSDYDADALSVSPDKYGGTVNDWISKKTGGALKSMDLGYKKAEFSILNAISFHGFWSSPFDKAKTKQYAFFSFDGSYNYVNFLCDKRDLWIGQNEKVIRARLDFGNGAYSIEFFKAADEMASEECLDALDIEMLRTLRIDEDKLSVNVRIPKLDIALKSDLIPAMRSLGINRVFNHNAQLDGISSVNSFFIGSVYQGCSFSIDEEGVVAKVVTVANGMDSSPGPLLDGGDFFLDHPFVFAIRENSSGAILFMGKIGKL